MVEYETENLRVGGSSPLLNNFYNLKKKMNMINFCLVKYFLVEIFLLFCILILIFYKFTFKERHSHEYSIVFLLYSIFSLIISIYLLNLTSNLGIPCIEESYKFFIVINRKVIFMKYNILFISMICLILFRDSLNKSRTNCIEYFICYLFTILICLILLMVNVVNILYFLNSLILLEILSLCFYILSSFNYTNIGSLLFRYIHIRKLCLISTTFTLLGVIFFKIYFIILGYSVTLIKGTIYYDFFYTSFLGTYYPFISFFGIFFILISLFIKMVVYYSPTDFIYYKKTPLITIIFMHIIPKITFFYFIVELILNNSLFFLWEEYVSVLILFLGLICLIISIGMRRLFLKHFLEYLALVNSGYLLLVFIAVNFKSLFYCLIFIYLYILIIWLYGGIALFFDNKMNPGKRVSLDFILHELEKSDYYSIIFSLLIFFFFGLAPTRRDYPCSRGIPFNGVILQSIILLSLWLNKIYLVFFFLVFFNYILFFFFIWTVLPFWYEKKDLIYDKYCKWLNLLTVEFFIFYNFIFLLSFQVNSSLFDNYLKVIKN